MSHPPLTPPVKGGGAVGGYPLKIRTNLNSIHPETPSPLAGEGYGEGDQMRGGHFALGFGTYLCFQTLFDLGYAGLGSNLIV